MNDNAFKWGRVTFVEPVIAGEYLDSPGRYEIQLDGIWVHIRLPDPQRVVTARATVVKDIAWE